MLKKVEEKRSLMYIIRSRQKNWIGHILRGHSLQMEIMEGWTDGKRRKGRPRQKLMDWIMGTDTKNSRKRHNIKKSHWTFENVGRKIT